MSILESCVEVSTKVPATVNVVPDTVRKLTLSIVVLGSDPVVFTKRFGALVNTPVVAPLVPEIDPV